MGANTQGNVAAFALGVENVVASVYAHMTRREAARVATVNRVFANASRDRCRSRLLVACSESGYVVELNPINGDVVQSVKVPDWEADLEKDTELQDPLTFRGWLTGIVFSPIGCLYVANHQVKGLQRFRGATLEYLGDCKLQALTPEGVACCQAYVVVAHEDWVLAVKEPHYANLSIYDENLVPTKVSVCTSLTDVDLIWGLCLGPEPEGDMLYLAEDQSYESSYYGEVPKQKATGRVLRAKIASNGSVEPDVEVFCSRNPVLVRPSGLCFCDAGYLFVTSLLGKVLQYSGPLSESPGLLLRTVVETGPRSLLTKPWDVLVKKGRLYVTSHNALPEREDGKVNVYDVASGELLHSWTHELFRQPNGLCWED